MRKAYKILVGNPEGKSYFGDLDLYGSIILKWLKKSSLRL
jgi:hypothetical protein